MKKISITFIFILMFFMLVACREVTTVESAVIDMKKNTSYEMSLYEMTNGVVSYAKIIRQGDLYQFEIPGEGLVLQEKSDLYTSYVYDDFYDIFLEKKFSNNLIAPFDQLITFYFTNVNLTWFSREDETLTIREDRRFSIPNNSPYKSATEATITLEKHVLKVNLKYANDDERRITVKLKDVTEIAMPDQYYLIENNAHFIYFIKDHKVHIVSLNQLSPLDTQIIPQMIEGRIVASIGKNAFKNFSGSHIIFAEDSMLEEIGPYAFRDIKLTSNMTLPNSIKTIHEKAFFNASISNIYFGNQLEFIGEHAFAYAKITKLYFSFDTDVSLYDENWNPDHIPYEIGFV